jgi:hypothetical protein
VSTVVILLALAALAGGVGLLAARRHSARQAAAYDSKVKSFRRHMDALSPEARRGVIDRVRAAQARDAMGE